MRALRLRAGRSGAPGRLARAPGVRPPFDLLFADGGEAKKREPQVLVEALSPGGIVLLDDLTPRELWPKERRGRRDPVREYWLNEPRVAATEIRPGPTEAAIIAARVRAG